MALELIANINSDASLEDLIRIVLGTNSEVISRSNAAIEGLTARESWVRVLHQSPGSGWDIPRDIFGIDYSVTIYMRLDYPWANEEILHIVDVLPDLRSMSPKAGLLQYQDLALARWRGEAIEVHEGGPYSSEIVASFANRGFDVQTAVLPEI